MLHYYPCTVIFYVISKTIKDLVVYQKQNSIHNSQIKNTILGNIERYFRKAILNKWDLYFSKRFNKENLSWLGYIYFNRVFEMTGDPIDYTVIDIYKHLNLDLKTIPSFLLDDFDIKAYSYFGVSLKVDEEDENLPCDLDEEFKDFS